MIDKKRHIQIAELKKLYNTPLASNRSGALYNAFSYPTKISPEAIGIFIACHTEVGDTVLDPFAGSGTTGLATKLCDKPTKYMIDTANSLGLNPKWGKRNAVLYELSTLGSFVASVMCNPPEKDKFEKHALHLLKHVEEELLDIYSVLDNDGQKGKIRHVIWSDVLVCPSCSHETTFWQNAVTENPLQIASTFNCVHCHKITEINKVPRATELLYDEVTNSEQLFKKRVPVKVYGRTGKKTWSRLITDEDISQYNNYLKKFKAENFPNYKINWGVLYRKGYHTGITHLHHLYTTRNAVVFSKLWNSISSYPEEYQDALKLLLLSYNSSHSTLMTRVVVKKNSTDFVITGSQSGVLYISNLPIEKNIFEGIKRKIKTFKQAFDLVSNSKSSVSIFNGSSTKLQIQSESIDYVFTDPPFGDYIPYSEINQINEAWLGTITDPSNEAIINTAQQKGLLEYKNLMGSVFSEVSRTLKSTGSVSLVFHSAKAEIWQALIDSYQQAGFQVSASSVLDKIQSSFKQINSDIKVQGDPLLLLTKSGVEYGKSIVSSNEYDAELIEVILNNAFVLPENTDEQKPERLFSRYINECIKTGSPVSLDAGTFYEIIKEKMVKHHLSH